MGFDISKQAEHAKAEDAGTRVHVEGLDGAPMYYMDEEGNEHPVILIVAGAHSSIYRRAEARQRKRKLKARSMTAEALFEDAIERAAECTLGWEGFYEGGEPAPFRKESVRGLYVQCQWVYEQVLEAMNDHTRFFSKESNS